MSTHHHYDCACPQYIKLQPLHIDSYYNGYMCYSYFSFVQAVLQNMGPNCHGYPVKRNEHYLQKTDAEVLSC